MTDRKRILFIAPQPFFQVRGTPIAIKDMLTILGEKYDIDLFTYPFGEEIKLKNVNQKRGFSFGFKSVKIGPSFKKVILDLGLFIKVLPYYLKNKYDKIHAVEEGALIGVFLKKLKKAELIYDMDSIMTEQIERSKLSKLSFIMKFMERSIIKNSDLVLAISNNFESYCKEMGLKGRFVTIWDVPQIIKNELPLELDKKFNTNKKRIVYIGNGEKYQGVELLENTAKLCPELEFFIIGTGKDGIIGNITYINKINMEYVWGVMQKADVLVSPRLEGTNTPMKIYTYMASGKPIVATNIPAHNVLKDCGILVKQDTKSYRQGIKKALSSQGKKLAKKAKTKVEKEYNFNKLNEIIWSNYEK